MSEAVTYAALIACCLVLPSVAVTRGSHLFVGDHGLLSRLAEHFSRRDDDLVALTVWALRRSEQLAAHLERLSGLLVRDASMSATRQLGNRLAYRQLVADLAAVPDLPEIDEDRCSRRDWLLLQRDLGPQPPLMTLPGRPDVELLDVGWR